MTYQMLNNASEFSKLYKCSLKFQNHPHKLLQSFNFAQNFSSGTGYTRKIGTPEYFENR